MDDDDYEPHQQRQGQGYTWEAEYKRSWDVLQEDDDGSLRTSIQNLKPRRRIAAESTPIKRGIIRHFILIIDCGRSMTDIDLAPNRLETTLDLVKEFVVEFFDQNPLSLMLIMGMKNGLCERWSNWYGTSHEMLADLDKVFEAEGDFSLQNALRVAHQALFHVPKHVSRETLILFGSLNTCDPSSIYETISQLQESEIKVSIIGLSAQLKVCELICKQTGGSYHVILGASHYKEMLHGFVIPPPLTNETKSRMIPMGFPIIRVYDNYTLCAW
jgi:transcription initiation factor TFIIH subunit 2